MNQIEKLKARAKANLRKALFNSSTSKKQRKELMLKNDVIFHQIELCKKSLANRGISIS